MAIVPDHLPDDIVLVPRHRDRLTDLGIPLHLALTLEARSITAAEDLPVGVATDAAPGLAFGGGENTIVVADAGGAWTVDGRAVLLPIRRPEGVDGPAQTLLALGVLDGLAAAAVAHAGCAVVAAPSLMGWADNDKPAKLIWGLTGVVTILAPQAPGRHRPTWDACQKLFAALAAAGCDVRVAAPPSGVGFATLLSGVPEADRAAVLGRLVSGAATKLPRQPAATKPTLRANPSQDATVDDVDACVRAPGWVDAEGHSRPGDILLQSLAPRIVATEVLMDDLAPAKTPAAAEHPSHVLVVRTGDGEDVPLTGGPVPDGELRDVRGWLSRVEGGIGSVATIRAVPFATAMIEGAVRTHRSSERRWIRTYPRTGWVEDEASGAWVYLGPSESIGPDGPVTSSLARVSYSIGWASDVWTADPAKAVRTLLDVATGLGRPELWWTLLGVIVHAWTGADAHGTLLIEGPQNAGKTSVASLAMSAMGRQLTRGMISARGTANAVAALGAGLHQFPAFVDDLARTSDRREREKAVLSLDLLLRRGYAGGVAGRERLAKDLADGRWGAAPKDLTNPQVIISADEVPEGLPPTAISRMVVYPVRRSEDTWVEAGSWEGRWKPLGTSGQLEVAGAYLIREVARMIRDAGGREAWLAVLQDPDFAPTMDLAWGSPRDREVVRPYAVGISVLTAICARLGIPELGGHFDAAMEALESVKAAREAAAATHSPGEKILDACHSAIASGHFALVDDADEETVSASVTRFGRRVNVDGTPCVALIAKQVHKVAATTTTRIRQDLPGILLGPGGETTRRVRIGDTPTHCIVIPEDVWERRQD